MSCAQFGDALTKASSTNFSEQPTSTAEAESLAKWSLNLRRKKRGCDYGRFGNPSCVACKAETTYHTWFIRRTADEAPDCWVGH
jgi:hypothetical protein